MTQETQCSVAALVPMRHDSERVPGKNYRTFAGKPLFHHILKTLTDCPLIDIIAVDTDSPNVKEGISDHFPHVRIIHRPEHLRDGATPMNEVLLHDVRQVEADVYLQTHSTNPLLKTGTVQKAVDLFLRIRPQYDSLFSVTRVQSRLWDQLARPVNHNPDILLRTQDLPPLYEENSCLYIFTRQVLETGRNRIGRRPYMFEMQPIESVDIDEELDFQSAEFFYKKLEKS